MDYNVNEQKEWEKDRQVSKGHRAQLSLEVSTSDVSRLGEVVAIAVKQGVQETGQLETYLSLQKEKNEYLNCLSIAAKDAQTKAQRLARELGRTVGEAQTIQEGRAEASPPVFKMMEAHNMMSAKTASSAPTVDAGTQSFTASIQVSFKLK